MTFTTNRGLNRTPLEIAQRFPRATIVLYGTETERRGVRDAVKEITARHPAHTRSGVQWRMAVCRALVLLTQGGT